MKDAVFLLDISYEDIDSIGPTWFDGSELHALRTFVITYTLDNVDVRVYAYRERACHLVSHIFGVGYPIDQEERRKHPEIKEKGYMGAINSWLESNGKEGIREALKSFDVLTRRLRRALAACGYLTADKKK
jgi:hypothetical protein